MIVLENQRENLCGLELLAINKKIAIPVNIVNRFTKIKLDFV